MVKSFSFRISAILLGSVLVFASTGCSVKKWWGEGKRKIVYLREKISGPGCPSAELILKGTETESLDAFNCLKKQVDGIWTQIKSEKPNSLNNAEIAILIRKGIIPIPGDPEKIIPRLFSIKRLLGFGDDINKSGVDAWVNWFSGSRAKMRSIYSKWTEHSTQAGPLVYQDAVDAAQIVSGALNTMGWELDSNELGRIVIEILDIKNPYNEPYIHKAILPAAKIVREVMGMLCVEMNRTDINTWRTSEIGKCVTRLADGLSPGATWFEFLANPTHSMTSAETQRIKVSLDNLNTVVRDWLADCAGSGEDSRRPETNGLCLNRNRFRDVALTKLHTDNFVELSKAMGAPPPEHFFDDLELIEYFPGGSTEHEITAKTLALFFSIFKDWQNDVLDGMRLYLQATQAHQCTDPNAQYWTQCILPDQGEKLRSESTSLDFALQVKSSTWGTAVAPMSGMQYSRIMLYRAVSKQIIEAFQDEEGYIYAFTKQTNGSDSLVKLITAGLHTSDTLKRLFSNINRQMNHQPLLDTTSSISLGKIDVRGLSNLLTIGADLMVDRPQNDPNIFVAIGEKFSLSGAPAGATRLDLKSVTAILTLADEMSKLRYAYLGLDPQTGDSPDGLPSYVRRAEYTDDFLIDRKAFFNPDPNGPLARAIRDHFPRTYASCMAFGFERSCFITLNEIVPSAYGKSTYIHQSDIDILTLVLVGFESLLDTCDYNKDGQLSTWENLGGFDELDCAVGRVADVVLRLIDSNILNWDLDMKTSMQSKLNIFNSNVVTRVIPKVMLVRGTQDGIVLNSLGWWLPKNKNASLGSMYGALAEIFNSTATHALDEKAKRENR